MNLSSTIRVSSLLAYSHHPSVILSAERARRFYGRCHEQHLLAEHAGLTRGDLTSI